MLKPLAGGSTAADPEPLAAVDSTRDASDFVVRLDELVVQPLFFARPAEQEFQS